MQNYISDIQITPIKPQNGLVGFASFIFNDCFYMSAIGIFTRPQGGFRLTYPTRAKLSGGLNIYHPIRKEIAEQIEQEVISKFEEIINKS
ncbi:MAG: SpoVG family protein [Candidatus Babeliaceae bacterium]|nr:SpoVG family protein [Candidatus Babeliaceae bacterium]